MGQQTLLGTFARTRSASASAAAPYKCAPRQGPAHITRHVIVIDTHFRTSLLAFNDILSRGEQ
jgi:hypothetical protein